MDMTSSSSFATSIYSCSPFLKTTKPNFFSKKQCGVRASTTKSDTEELGGNSMKKESNGCKMDLTRDKPLSPLLDAVNFPAHMKNLSAQELEQLASELRSDILHKIAETGGHFGPNLGVVELTIALHYVFDTPQDRIVWDVGHQAYPHKILTGRRSRMHTIRKTSGLSGFPKRDESVYDTFGAGHSSTSISAGLGMAVARDLLGKNNNVISVIGDGAMTGGQAYEAINNAGFLNANLIVVLNDNKQVSLPTATIDGPASPVGALSTALTKLRARTEFKKLRKADKAAGITKQNGGIISSSSSTFFEELGFHYIGPVDGHNIEYLVTIFQELKATPTHGPILIHVVTEKGKGYPPAETADDKMHAAAKFDLATGQQEKTESSTLPNSRYFVESLIKEAEADDKIVAIHAAMGGSTCLNYFHKKFPYRCFDVGIAEQHAVTFAAGLATEGLKPFCTVNSTFLQRGFDQIHDVSLQKLPVRFAVDRAGLVGADGPTHCGTYDVTYIACLPNMVVMAPSDEAELMHMVATAAAIDDRPSCFRYPRGNGIGAVLPPNYKGTPLEIGKGRVLTEGDRVALLGYGSMVQQCLEAAQVLKTQYNIYVTVVDARFCKPLDTNLIRQLSSQHEFLITVEEGSIGGFGSHVSHFLDSTGIIDGNLKLRTMIVPDRYIDQGSQEYQIEEAGISSSHISATVLSLLGKTC